MPPRSRSSSSASRLRQFRGECQFSTWLHRLVVNTCRDLAERQQACGEARRSTMRATRARAEEDDPSRLALVADLRRELAAASRPPHGGAAPGGAASRRARALATRRSGDSSGSRSGRRSPTSIAAGSACGPRLQEYSVA